MHRGKQTKSSLRLDGKRCNDKSHLVSTVIRKGIQLGSGGDRDRWGAECLQEFLWLRSLTHSLTHADIIIRWVNGAFSTGRWHATGMFMDGFDLWEIYNLDERD